MGKSTSFALFLALLLLCGGGMQGCAAQGDYFDLFRGGFSAELKGELNGVAFSALLVATPVDENGARALTVTFYAPQGLLGTVAHRAADGGVTLSVGDVVLADAAAKGLAPLFDLFPTTGEVRQVSITEEGYTKVEGDGFALTFLPDGTPIRAAGVQITADVVRFETV